MREVYKQNFSYRSVFLDFLHILKDGQKFIFSYQYHITYVVKNFKNSSKLKKSTSTAENLDLRFLDMLFLTDQVSSKLEHGRACTSLVRQMTKQNLT